jgi:hypothetical protein
MTSARRPTIIIVMEGAPICPVCIEPLGVYEPLLAVSATSARRLSLAREGLPASETVMHRSCAPESAVALLSTDG